MNVSVRRLNAAIQLLRQQGKKEVATFLNNTYLLPAVEKKASELFISNRNVEVLGIRNLLTEGGEIICQQKS